MGQPSVFPHGTTIYNPEKCWNGYTIVPLINDGVLLFDMNGNEVRRWSSCRAATSWAMRARGTPTTACRTA